jgi:radical SAM protein with 4Fe4S-binding SPASM domain
LSFILRNEFFGGLLYDVAGKNYYHLDHATVAVLRSANVLCREEYSDSPSINEAEQAALRNELSTLGALGNTTFLNNTPGEGLLSAPLRVFYDITYRCSEACKHCFTDSGRGETDELNLEEKTGLIDQLVDMACFRVSIAGGEPLLDQHFFPFVDYALRRGIDVSFSTNAAAVTDSVAERLARTNIRTINVSLDGWDEQSFAIVRGHGRFPRVLQGIDRLRRKYSGRLAAKCTIMRTNVGHLERIIALAAEHGFDAIKFNGVRLAGRARTQEWLFPTQDEYLQALSSLADLHDTGHAPINLELPANPYQTCEEGGAGSIDELGPGCYAAKESLCVTPCGDITPCSSFGRGRFTDGNVRVTPILEAWRCGSSMSLFRAKKNNPECLACSALAACRGGCHQRAFYMYGTLDDVDPYCFKRKNRPWDGWQSTPDGGQHGAL